MKKIEKKTTASIDSIPLVVDINLTQSIKEQRVSSIYNPVAKSIPMKKFTTTKSIKLISAKKSERDADI